MNRFKSTEWSGPAWYKVEESYKNGFPKRVKLKYFKPIHLGHGTETELDGNKMGELLPKVYKRFPNLKECYLGLIHSHHNMGAFLSPTDEATALEQTAKDGLFFSTVVASAKEPFDCCMTYQDQFGFSNLIDGEVALSGPPIKVPKEWETEAVQIEEEKKAEVKTAYTHGNQLSIYNGYSGYYGSGYGSTVPDIKKNKQKTEKVSSAAWDMETNLSKEEKQKMKDLLDQLEEGSITYNELIEQVHAECPNIDPHLFMDALAYGKIIV